MSHDRTAHGASARDDEELRKVDERSKAAAEQDHHPLIRWGRLNGREFIRPRNEKHEHYAAYGCLVEEKLEAIHFVFALVGRDPDCVDGANEDTCES